MRPPLRNRHLLLIDCVLLGFALYLSFVLRLDQLDLGGYWPGFLLELFWIVLLVPLVFWLSGIYASNWYYASIDELLLLLRSFLPAVLIAQSAQLLVGGPYSVPRSVPVIFMVLGLAGVSGPRFALRRWRHVLLPANETSPPVRRRGSPGGQPLNILVVGANQVSAMLVHKLRASRGGEAIVVGFVDDDPATFGTRIQGVEVLGARSQLADLIDQLGVDEVIIAMPAVSGRVVREILAVCERAAVQTRIIPDFIELVDGKVSVSQLQEVQIADLLRRLPVQTDTLAVRGIIAGKRVLITGGGGSIGSELCRRVLRYGPEQLIILGHGENSVFEIHAELQREAALVAPASRVGTVIADIRFPERIQAVFAALRPQVVFHAAAHKHVPLMQQNILEAISTNVLGTWNVLRAAEQVGVERFVMISTDKAVNPSSIMGASKRVAELLVLQTAARSGRPYVAVRFGNVLGSRGSVVLTFRQQIAAGGPVTVTHPEMRRYFMTIPEAVQLVLQAGTQGRGGEIFMLNMGEPVKIVDLACDMIELSGLRPGQDIDIQFVGMRPGEKLYEELFSAGEQYASTAHPSIFIAVTASSAIPACLDSVLEQFRLATQQHNEQQVLPLLRRLIPELQIAALPLPLLPPVGSPVEASSAMVVGSLQERVVGNNGA